MVYEVRLLHQDITNMLSFFLPNSGENEAITRPTHIIAQMTALP
jgi:hypothetical protein